MSSLFEKILAARGISADIKASFLKPDYSGLHDPFLLPDMKQAADRLVMARKKQEKITIYGDYDIDGLTATALLSEALKNFGFTKISMFMPNRFVEGYGLNIEAIERIASDGTELIMTVDCGSRSHKEIERANELGIDVIVTDHHEVPDVLPPAAALINPHRPDSKYPFSDLAGVGVAFKLVQALQVKLNKSPSTGSGSSSSGLPFGQEKWLLDLVALGTVCDIVPLIGENRTIVYWGLKVLARKRRPGLKALLAVGRIEDESINARALGFGLGPRMNAAGRLETAQHALDLLIASDSLLAFEKAQILDELNSARRIEQAKIQKEAVEQAEKYPNDSVLVVSSENWNHGVVGIVASKLLEKYKKPVFIFQEIGEQSRGSARSFGDFSAAEAIEVARDLITSGGGHKLAAGVTLPTMNIPEFRKKINQFYAGKKLKDQSKLLLPSEDTMAELHEITEELIDMISQLEPFGHGNPRPILKSDDLLVISLRRMGAEAQHVKLELQNIGGKTMQFLAFSAPEHFFVEPGEMVSVWYSPNLNEWQGKRTVEGYIEHLEVLSHD